MQVKSHFTLSSFELCMGERILIDKLVEHSDSKAGKKLRITYRIMRSFNFLLAEASHSRVKLKFGKTSATQFSA